MVRYNRMKGRPTLWLPGTDHAGIATQVDAISRTSVFLSISVIYRISTFSYRFSCIFQTHFKSRLLSQILDFPGLLGHNCPIFYDMIASFLVCSIGELLRKHGV